MKFLSYRIVVCKNILTEKEQEKRVIPFLVLLFFPCDKDLSPVLNEVFKFYNDNNIDSPHFFN